jgi:hypothetical protein
MKIENPVRIFVLMLLPSLLAARKRYPKAMKMDPEAQTLNIGYFSATCLGK